MSYELITDHWIVAVIVGDSHGNSEYIDSIYCQTEEEMKNTLEKVMNSYYERVDKVSEVKIVKYDFD